MRKTKLYRCDNCDFETDDGDSIQPWWEASEILERLECNGIVPYGVCPECDCFVYKYDDTLLAYDAAKDLLEACKMALWYYETFRDKSPVGETEKDDVAFIRGAIAKAKGTPDA